MNKRDFELLEQNGWMVECESPFEIRHIESGSFASEIAADMILGVIQRENEGKLTKYEYQEKIRNLTTYLVKVCPTPTPERLDIIVILNQSIDNEYPR
jgi:hypothetical protein